MLMGLYNKEDEEAKERKQECCAVPRNSSVILITMSSELSNEYYNSNSQFQSFVVSEVQPEVGLTTHLPAS